MDVVEIEASSDKHRLLYDTKGRFRLLDLGHGEGVQLGRGVTSRRRRPRLRRTTAAHPHPPPAVKVHDAKVDLSRADRRLH